MNCSICKSNIKLIIHHLSYNPEITVTVCTKCHLALHNLARMSQEQRNIVNEWVEQYGDLWEEGTEKYYESEHYKNIKRESNRKHQKTNESKNYHKERYLKNLTPDKMLKRIEKMEKRLGVRT